MPYTYEYPRPVVAVDCAIFGREAGVLKLLLIERGNDPFAGCWALPGGFLEMDETLEDGALRELNEETGMGAVFLEQLHAFSALDRDPRGRTIGVAFYGMVDPGDHTLRAADDARDAAWFDVEALPELAFDHADIVALARKRLSARESNA